ncbi:MAG: VOC family protein [Stackebrandtia sp.]
MPITLGLIGITTADLNRSLAFYRGLGIAVPDADGTEPHLEVTLPNGPRLAWDALETVRGFDPGFKLADGRSAVSLAFELSDPSEVDETYQRVAADFGGHLAPWDAPWGQRYAILLDPDGNTVDLFASN